MSRVCKINDFQRNLCVDEAVAENKCKAAVLDYNENDCIYVQCEGKLSIGKYCSFHVKLQRASIPVQVFQTGRQQRKSSNFLDTIFMQLLRDIIELKEKFNQYTISLQSIIDKLIKCRDNGKTDSKSTDEEIRSLQVQLDEAKAKVSQTADLKEQISNYRAALSILQQAMYDAKASEKVFRDRFPVPEKACENEYYYIVYRPGEKEDVRLAYEGSLNLSGNEQAIKINVANLTRNRAMKLVNEINKSRKDIQAAVNEFNKENGRVYPVLPPPGSGFGGAFRAGSLSAGFGSATFGGGTLPAFGAAGGSGPPSGSFTDATGAPSDVGAGASGRVSLAGGAGGFGALSATDDSRKPEGAVGWLG